MRRWQVLGAALAVVWAGCDDGSDTPPAPDLAPAVEMGTDGGPDQGDMAAPDMGDMAVRDLGEPDQGDMAAPDLGDMTAPDMAEADMGDMAAPDMADMAAPDMADMAAPDMADPDMGDMAVADMAAPDMGDMAQPDMADMAEPDMAEPDMAEPDMAGPDMAEPDMAAPMLEITTLEAWCNAPQASLAVRASGGLAGAPALQLRLGLRDAAGAVVPFADGAEWADLDRFEARTAWAVEAGEFSFEARRAAAADLARVTGVTLQVEDTEGRVAEAQAECPAPPVLMAGADGCDDLQALAQCPDGQACAPGGRCRDAAPPTLRSAVTALDPEGRGFSVAVEGSDADGDVRAARVQLLTAAGAPAAPRALDIPLRVRPDAQGFLASGGGRLPNSVRALAQVAAAQVSLIDETGLASEPLRVAVQRPLPLASGQVCDPIEAFDRCPAEDACVFVDGDPAARAVCAPAPEACPEAWPVAEIAAAGEGPWQAEGALAAGVTLTAAASCGAGPSQAALRFVAPADGAFQVSLADGPAGAIVFGRSACAVAAPRFEQGCGAEFSVALRAGEPVTVWVAGPPGPFTVAVAQEVP